MKYCKDKTCDQSLKHVHNADGSVSYKLPFIMRMRLERAAKALGQTTSEVLDDIVMNGAIEAGLMPEVVKMMSEEAKNDNQV